MGTSRLFYPAGIKIGATYLGNTANQRVSNNLGKITLLPSGHALPRFTGVKDWAPEYSLDCYDLAAALALMTVENICAPIAFAYLGDVDVDLYFREATPGALMEAVDDDTKHVVYRMEDDAMLWWESITAGQDDDAAKIAIKLGAAFNGVDDLVQVPLSEEIEPPAAAVDPWTLGPIKANGEWIDGLKSVSWNLNPEVVKTKSDGDAAPTHIHIKSVKPVIQFETTALHTLRANYDMDGEPVTALSSFFRRRRQGKRLWADNQSKHLKLSAAVGAQPGTDAVGTLFWEEAGGDPGTAKCEIHLQESLTGSAMLVVAVNQAIA